MRQIKLLKKNQIANDLSIFDLATAKSLINLKARNSVKEQPTDDKQVKSSLNVKSRNGYLFMTASGSQHDKIKVARPDKSYCRFKYFESLPKYSVEQPCVGVGSPYKGSYEQTV